MEYLSFCDNKEHNARVHNKMMLVFRPPTDTCKFTKNLTELDKAVWLTFVYFGITPDCDEHSTHPDFVPTDREEPFSINEIRHFVNTPHPISKITNEHAEHNILHHFYSAKRILYHGLSPKLLAGNGKFKYKGKLTEAEKNCIVTKTFLSSFENNNYPPSVAQKFRAYRDIYPPMAKLYNFRKSTELQRHCMAAREIMDCCKFRTVAW